MKKIKELFAVAKFIARHPLNAGYSGRSLVNFLRWQTGSRLLKKKVIVPWVDGSKFAVGLGETGLTGNLYAGFVEYEDMLFVLHALQPAEVFVDVGANVGAYTILASAVVGSRSISFEPVPETAERMRDQICLNRIEAAVDIRNVAVGDTAGEVFFTNNADTVNKVSLAGEDTAVTRVEIKTLNGELPEGLRYFLKVDVEGYEYNVIKGASETLSSGRVSAVIIELNGSGDEYGHSNQEVHEQLLSFDFVAVSYDPIKRKLKKLETYNKDRGNTIYVKNFEEMAERCRHAPRHTIHTAHGMEL